jgi:hypothetical protein
VFKYKEDGWMKKAYEGPFGGKLPIILDTIRDILNGKKTVPRLLFTKRHLWDVK